MRVYPTYTECFSYLASQSVLLTSKHFAFVLKTNKQKPCDVGKDIVLIWCQCSVHQLTRLHVAQVASSLLHCLHQTIYLERTLNI